MRNSGYLLLDDSYESYLLCEMHKRNSISWKRRSAFKGGLSVVSVFRILLFIALAVGAGAEWSCEENQRGLSLKDCFLDHTKNLKPINPVSKQPIDQTGAEALDDRPPAEDVSRQACNEDICLSLECIHTASTVLKNMDPDVEPCDNFYRFACGGFLKSTLIPGDKAFVNTASVITDNVQEQLRASIEEPSEPNEQKSLRLIKNLYKSCMNKTAIENEGLETLYRKLETLGGWPVVDGEMWNETDFDWLSSIYKFRNAGFSVDYFIGFSIGVDMKNTTRRVIELDQADLGLSRATLLRGIDDKNVRIYYGHMMNMALIFGAERDRASAELNESLLFEINLANISLSNKERRDVTRLYNPMTLDELMNKYPSIPWRKYFGNLLPKNISVEENDVVIVNVPSFISDLEKLLSNTPKKVQANYVMWRAVGGSIAFLNNIHEGQLANSPYLSRRTDRESRSQTCVALVSRSLSVSVGAMYVRKYFNEEAKQNAVDMVTDIREQFKKILEQVEWMDEKTRKRALEKAAAMSSHIAYPDEVLDDAELEEFYENLELTGGNYLESILNLTRFNAEYLFSKLREPVNKNDWISNGKTAVVDGFYSPAENSIRFSAGILQGGYFSNNRPRYMNYGAIGFDIGHEITHGFDVRGRRFDKNGNRVNWWTSSTKEKFRQRAECIIHQYGNYTVKEVGLEINGIDTQIENIADNGGIKAAYLAYNDWVGRNKPEQKLPALPYSANQMFWISAANSWCSKYRPEILKHQIITSQHTPSEFRIIGSLSNMPEFSKDFNCPIGSKMNPEKKCSVF